MTAQKRERPEFTVESQKNRPDITGGKPGTMPENPASVDHRHEPAGLAPGTDRTKEHPAQEHPTQRGKA
jgi:hypothetical protein